MTSKRVEKMSVSGIRKVFELSQNLENPIDLSIGKPDFEIPINIKKAAKKAIDDNLNEYSLTFGIKELRLAIANKLKLQNDIETTQDNVIITSAVSGALSVAIPTLIDCEDEVIFFDPYFVGYKELILLYGGVPIAVKKNDDFSLNVDALKKAVTSNTKIIIINTPENPTGHVWNIEELKSVVEIAKDNNITIISDEIYNDFIYDGEKHVSIASIYENVVTIGGFSKSHAMTGWRIGYLHAQSEIIEQIMKIQQYTFVCAPTPFQYAALEAVTTDISKHVAQYENRRNLLYNSLKDNYQIIQSQGAFYFFIKYPYDAKLFIDRCLKKNLLVVPGSVFSGNDEYFRISFATSEVNIKKAINVLNDISVL